MFLMSLAIADLTVGTIVMPISSAYAITGTRDGSGYAEDLISLRIIFGADATLYNMVSLYLGNVCHLS